jgi:hypothetical protein
MTLITLILWKRHNDLKFVMYNVRLNTIFFSPGRLKDVLVEMNLLVCVLLHWSLLAMYKVFINSVQVTWKNPWCDVTHVDIFNFSPKGHQMKMVVPTVTL